MLRVDTVTHQLISNRCI